MPDPDKRLCWKCGTEYDRDVRICVRCGVDLVSGAQLGSAGADDARPRGALAFIDSWIPGVFRPLLILASLLVGALGIWVMMLGLTLGMFVAFSVGAGGLIIYAQAVAWMLVGRFMALTGALSEIEGKQWLLFCTFMTIPVTIVLAAVAGAAS